MGRARIGEAIALVRDRLGLAPYDLMDDAVQAAVAAAGHENVLVKEGAH
jgi:hypothetical protein